jgi:hypothetical protein
MSVRWRTEILRARRKHPAFSRFKFQGRLERKIRGHSMSKLLRGTAIALVVCGSVSLAAAAEQALNLTAAQKHTIYQSVMNEKGQTAPSSFRASIGAKVPSSLTLRQLPRTVASQIPKAKNYEFAKLQNNEVLLVDPKNRQVAEMITSPSTTGSSK